MSSPLAQPGPPARRSRPARNSGPARGGFPAGGGPGGTADRLSIAHQKEVATIAGGVSSVVGNLALGADPLSVSTWFFAAIDAMVARIQAGYALNRNSAMGYLRQHGALHGAQVTPMPGSLDVAALRRRLEITGPIGFKSAIAAGQDTDEALHHMATNMSGVADEYVRNGDRDVITQTAQHGRGVVGWRRRLSGRACGFCAMLASRGAVYVDRKSATIAKDGMAYHAHCHCWAEPLYTRQQEPADVQRLQAQWRRVTAGRSGKDAQRVWRQHWDHRATDAGRIRNGLPARASGATARPTAGAEVRRSLQAARTPQQVSKVLADEYKQLTGRDIAVDFKGSVTTAREHAEGVLRVAERYPDVALDSVKTQRLLLSYAEYDERGLIFSDYYSGVARRERYMSELAGDAKTHFHPYDTPVGMAVHEMGHAVAVPLGDDLRAAVEKVLARRGRAASQISGYAERNVDELMAEAFADVLMNGERASALSREVMALVDDAYKRGGGTVRAAATAESRLPVAIDRSLSPAEVIAQEERARTAALAAPPVKLRELPERGAAAKALRHYQRFGDEEANGLLRRGKVGRPSTASKTYKPPAEAQVRSAIGTIDETLARSELSEGITVFRGMSRSPIAGEPGSIVGRSFSEKGYMSTSASRREAVQFATGEQTAQGAVMLEIRVPAGTRAVGISDETFKGASPSVMSEQEILLDRGLQFRVVSDEMRGDVYRLGSQTGVTDRQYRHIVVEVVPPAPTKAAKALASRPELSRVSVTQLKARVAQDGITVPTGLRRPALEKLVADLDRGVAPAAARARAVESIVDERRQVGAVLQDVAEALANDASPRALAFFATQLERLPAELKASRTLAAALRAGDVQAARAEVAKLATAAKLKPVGTVGEVRSLDRARMEWVGDSRGDVVQIVRPGFETTFERQTVLVGKAAVQPATAEQIAARAPAKVAKKVAPAKATRLTPAQAEKQLHHAEDWAAAARDGRVSVQVAGKRIREMAQGQADSAAMMRAFDGQRSPVTGLVSRMDEEQLARLARYDAEAKRLRALANEVDPPKAAKAVAKKAAPAKKVTAPKAPPAPEKLSIPALKTELQRHIDAVPVAQRVDLTGVPKPTLARWVSRSRELPPDAMQAEVGRWRQVVIDKRRSAAEMLAEADELVANGASAATLGARGAGALRAVEQALDGWPELAEVRKVVTAMQTGDAAKVRRALAAAEKKLGLRRVGPQAGSVTRVEPGMVDIAGGPAKYEHAAVVRPGYEVEIGGQRVVLAKPVVEDIMPSPKALQTHLREIERGLPNQSGSEVVDLLHRQAALTPRTAMKLEDVHVPGQGSELRELFRQRPTVNAYYASDVIDNKFLPAFNQPRTITFNPELFGTEAEQAARARLIAESRGAGWFGPTGAQTDAGYVFAHEYGHHVAFTFTSADHTVSANVNERLVQAVIREFGLRDQNPKLKAAKVQLVPKTGKVREADLTYLILYNGDAVRAQLSGLGASNWHEFLAEVWQEWVTLGTEARPAVRAVGKIMQELAEETL